MIRLLSFSFLFLCFSWNATKAQVVITKKNFPDPGDDYQTKNVVIKPSELPWRLFDTTRATFDVDVSQLGSATTDSLIFELPKDVAGGRDVSNAEFAIETSFGNIFFKRKGDILEIVGLAPDIGLPTPIGFQFDKPLSYLETPLTYPDTYKDSTTAVRDLLFAKVYIKMRESYEVNGYGRMRIPGGQWFNAIRIRRKYDFDITIKPVAGPETVEKALLVNWEFYSDSVVHTILRADTRLVDNGSGGQDTVVVFVFSDKNLPVSNSIVNQIDELQMSSIIDGDFWIKAPEQNMVFDIYNCSGKLVNSNILSEGINQFDFRQLESGLYLVRLNSADGSVTTGKFIKQ